ncbi:MAG: nitric-oxide reductase, partial [Candidatus Kapabacteria bacterium]|nr:nitric-oxide reductase [Candidatus Kapabacteria bacterium]
MSSLLDRKNWWKIMLALSIFSAAGLLFMTVQTYRDAPPKAKFVTNTGKTVFTVGSLEHGQTVFKKYALMDRGSIFGDGGYRGQDYTAECLHETALLMNKYYQDRLPESDDQLLNETAKLGVEEKVRFEIKQNLYNPENNEV